MVDRQGDLDSLQGAVARALEPLGKVSVATPFKSIRRVTVQHTSGASVRVIISGEFRKRAYVISILKVMDDFNPTVTHLRNHTIRCVQPDAPELGDLVEQVREALEALAQLP